jgi:hypothetical protein
LGTFDSGAADVDTFDVDFKTENFSAIMKFVRDTYLVPLKLV